MQMSLDLAAHSRFVLIWVFLVGVCSLGHPAKSLAQDKTDMPWYDAETEQLVPIGVKQREKVDTGERNSVTLRQNSQQPRPNVGAINAPQFGSVLTMLIWAGAIMLAVLLIGLIVWAFLRSRVKTTDELESIPRRSLAESIKQLPLELDANNGDFRQMARDAASAGDLRMALIYLFSHVLVSLDQQGFVRLKKGKTNRQYLQELTPYRQLAGFYGPVMMQFERSFFGDHQVDAEEFNLHWNRLDQFHSQLNQTQLKTGG